MRNLSFHFHAAFYLLAFFYFSYAQAQIAIIKDPDGYTNVRDGSSSSNKVIGKVRDGEVFWYDPTGGNGWAEVYFGSELMMTEWETIADLPKNRNTDGSKVYEWGYMHNSRIQDISPQPVKKQNEIASSLQLDYQDLSIAIHKRLFLPDEHKIVMRKDQLNIVHTIDGYYPLGVDGRIPKEEIESVLIRFFPGTNQEKALSLPPKALKGLFEPSLRDIELYSLEDNRILISMKNSDGAGAYEVVWMIHNGIYKDRFIGPYY